MLYKYEQHIPHVFKTCLSLECGRLKYGRNDMKYGKTGFHYQNYGSVQSAT